MVKPFKGLLFSVPEFLHFSRPLGTHITDLKPRVIHDSTAKDTKRRGVYQISKMDDWAAEASQSDLSDDDDGESISLSPTQQLVFPQSKPSRPRITSTPSNSRH